jgi:protein PsiE
MLEIMRRLSTATNSLHRGMKDAVDTFGALLVDAFHYLALFAIGATTVWSAAAAFIGMVTQGRASLGDILLLFIYLEIGAMVGIYFKTTRLPVRYLIYVAITALGRVLIDIVGAEHRIGAEHRTGTDILVITGAILLLSFAVLVLRFGSYKYPSERPAADLAR